MISAIHILAVEPVYIEAEALAYTVAAVVAEVEISAV
jgi:hypothetical protein